MDPANNLSTRTGQTKRIISGGARIPENKTIEVAVKETNWLGSFFRKSYSKQQKIEYLYNPPGNGWWWWKEESEG
eukprot:CAMPEP_0172489600 /NCGR_PEP_ID=MMETSP1066-20121228/19717_1 /TAXON_ID=671091 /ORGANISM="Coscinodiscus wailesii, Strain CCMP2513" /LENGTH=74 /DNA_ID=CAMNT_0013257579 /DNA_START=108 /DNA_END=332 /DNA_ORIENTATION=-